MTLYHYKKQKLWMSLNLENKIMNIIISVLCFMAGAVFGMLVSGLLNSSRGNIDENSEE
jgi:hypothetical protein